MAGLHVNLIVVGVLVGVAAVAVGRYRSRWIPARLVLASLGAVVLAATFAAPGLSFAPPASWVLVLVIGAAMSAAWGAQAVGEPTISFLLAAAAVAVFVTVPDTELITALAAALGVSALGALVVPTSIADGVAPGIAGACIALAGASGSVGVDPALLSTAAILALVSTPAIAARFRSARPTRDRRSTIVTVLVVSTAMLAVGRLGGIRSTELRSVVVGVVAIVVTTALMTLLTHRRH